MSLSLGVAIGALILQASRGMRGEAQLTQMDFAIAFWIVAAIGAISVISFLRLPEGAGAELASVPARTAVTPYASAANPHAEATAPQ